jgi:hypothetical protein
MGSVPSRETFLEKGGAGSWDEVDIPSLTRMQVLWWYKMYVNGNVYISNEDMGKLVDRLADFRDMYDAPKIEAHFESLKGENMAAWASMNILFERKLEDLCYMMNKYPGSRKTEAMWNVFVATGDIDLLDWVMLAGTPPPFPGAEKRWAADPTYANLLICFVNGVVPEGYQSVLPEDVWDAARHWWPAEVLYTLPPTNFIEELCRVVAERPFYIASKFELLVPRCETDPRDKTFIVQGALDCQNDTELMCILNTWGTPPPTYA